MWIFRKIFALINACQFRWVIGFWPSDLKKLFIKLMGRDDEDGWTTLYPSIEPIGIIELMDIRDGEFIRDLEIYNTIMRYGNYYFAVGGMYEDASSLNILAGGAGGGEIVLRVDTWKTDFVAGEWQEYIKVLIREYL